MDLDFSELSDDQLIGLVRAALQECARRNPAVANAARAATLDEAEKAKVYTAAADREAAKLRAAERERVAKEAAEAVQRQTAAQQAIDREARIAKKAADALAEAEAQEAKFRAMLFAAAALVGKQPAEISICVLANDARYGGGKRVLINPGASRYERAHLVDYCGPTSIKTCHELIGKKKELIPFCADLSARWNQLHVSGADYTWEKEVAHV